MYSSNPTWYRIFPSRLLETSKDGGWSLQHRMLSECAQGWVLLGSIAGKCCEQGLGWVTATRSHLWGSGAPTASQGEDDSTPRPFRRRRNCSNAPGLQPSWAAQVEHEIIRAGYQPESRLQVGGSAKIKVWVCVCVSCSVMPYSLWPHELQPARLLCPWNSPGKKVREI